MITSPRIGLVLGAGGVPGGAYIRAVLAEIETVTGWSTASATTIIGTSVGALNGARQPLPNLAAPATSEQLSGIAHLSGALSLPNASVATPLVAKIRHYGGQAAARLAPAGSHPQDYDVAAPPYHPGVVAVSVVRRSGRRRATVLANAGFPQDELYASAAVPGYALPVIIDGEERIDGAVWSSTNADLVGIEDHDALVVIAPMAARMGGNLLARTHRAQLIVELRRWAESGKPLVVVNPTGEEQQLRPVHAAFAATGRQRVRDGWDRGPM